VRVMVARAIVLLSKELGASDVVAPE